MYKSRNIFAECQSYLPYYAAVIYSLVTACVSEMKRGIVRLACLM